MKICENNKDIFYWSGKGEVDFVYGNKAVNVTSFININEREIEALLEFAKRHKNFELMVVSKNAGQKGKVKIMPIIDFLIE